jgi:ribosomal protein L11 methyltransferase
MAVLKGILKPSKGQLLLSGLLTTDQDIITEACAKHGLSLNKRQEKNNWLSLLFVNG